MVVARLQDAWQTLRGGLAPAQVALDLSDRLLALQALPQQKSRQQQPQPLLVPVPSATCRQGEPVEVEALGDFIGDLMLTQGLISAHLRVALPAAAAHWRVLTGPRRRFKEDPVAWLRQQRPDLGLPFVLEDAYLDVAPLLGGEADALVLAIHRDLMLRWLEVFSIAGVALDRLVPSQLAVMAALQPQLEEADPASLVVLLEPEPKALRILVWHRGVPIYERLLPGDAPAQVSELGRCLKFLRWQQKLPESAACALLLDQTRAESESPEQLQDLGDQLERRGLALDLADSAGYGSLCLRGLALLEGAA